MHYGENLADGLSPHTCDKLKSLPIKFAISGKKLELGTYATPHNKKWQQMTLSLQTTDYVINRPDIVFLHEIVEANNLLQSTWDIVTTSLSDGMTFTLQIQVFGRLKNWRYWQKYHLRLTKSTAIKKGSQKIKSKDLSKENTLKFLSTDKYLPFPKSSNIAK